MKKKNSNILNITPRAVEQISCILKSAPDNVVGVRLSVKSSGCSGYSYFIEYANNISKFDDIIDIGSNLNFMVDKKAVLFLIGSTMDYISETFKSGFIFTNPQEKSKCGCGKSFSV